MNISYNGNSGLYSGTNVTDLALGETPPEHIVVTFCFPVSESALSPACYQTIAGLCVCSFVYAYMCVLTEYSKCQFIIKYNSTYLIEGIGMEYMASHV